MRTTITLDPDVALLVERQMAARGARFKDVVNDALRRQLGSVHDAPTPSFATRARNLGPANVDLTRANQLAGALEDEELARKLAEGR